MSSTHLMLTSIQSWSRLPWSPAWRAKLARMEEYLIRRMKRDEG